MRRLGVLLISAALLSVFLSACGSSPESTPTVQAITAPIRSETATAADTPTVTLTTIPTPSPTVTASAAGWKDYTVQDAGLSVSLPEDWREDMPVEYKDYVGPARHTACRC